MVFSAAGAAGTASPALPSTVTLGFQGSTLSSTTGAIAFGNAPNLPGMVYIRMPRAGTIRNLRFSAFFGPTTTTTGFISATVFFAANTTTSPSAPVPMPVFVVTTVSTSITFIGAVIAGNTFYANDNTVDTLTVAAGDYVAMVLTFNNFTVTVGTLVSFVADIEVA
jgi:hypothetical protein